MPTRCHDVFDVDAQGGNVTRTTVERRIEYATPPGTLCMVAEPGKHGGAFDASNCRLGLVKRMDDDVAVFVNPTGRQNERRSKNFWAYDLRPGLSPWTHLRLSCEQLVAAGLMGNL